MTLPSSGAISLSNVDTELGLSSTAQISMNCTNVRTLFGVPSGAISMSNGYGKSNITPPGSIVYTTPGAYTWYAPSGVNKVSVVAVGGGGSTGILSNGYYCGYYGSQYIYSMSGGGGGGLGYKNNISVTPGSGYTVVVGCSAGDSYFINSSTVKGGGGSNGPNGSVGYRQQYVAPGAPGGTFVGDGGGNGGAGGCTTVQWSPQRNGISGGGGAGGYCSTGGYGATFNQASAPGPYSGSSTYGGGGGGSWASNFLPSCPHVGNVSGGGVGLYGQLSGGGQATSCNNSGASALGGYAYKAQLSGFVFNGYYCSQSEGLSFGGGAGGRGQNTFFDKGPFYGNNGLGAKGGVRIVWPGCTRQFPATKVLPTFACWGEIFYTIPGAYTWYPPAGVSKISVVAVGGGGGGSLYLTNGGTGGGLGYRNNISVCSSVGYTVRVGRGGFYNAPGACCYSITDSYTGAKGAGCDSYFNSRYGGPTSAVGGGGRAQYSNSPYFAYCGGGFSGDGGGRGGRDINSNSGGSQNSGGGGAGGYGGPGGNSGNAQYPNGTSGSCGGGGGGTVIYNTNCNKGWVTGGGGVGLYGKGPSGAGGVGGNFPSCPYPHINHLSTGQAGSKVLGLAVGGHDGWYGYSLFGCGYGGRPGGGAGGYYRYLSGAGGGCGAVRIVWPGCKRKFPSCCVGHS